MEKLQTISLDPLQQEPYPPSVVAGNFARASRQASSGVSQAQWLIIIAASCCVFLLIIIIIFLFLVWRRRRNRKKLLGKWKVHQAEEGRAGDKTAATTSASGGRESTGSDDVEFDGAGGAHNDIEMEEDHLETNFFTKSDKKPHNDDDDLEDDIHIDISDGKEKFVLQRRNTGFYANADSKATDSPSASTLTGYNAAVAALQQVKGISTAFATGGLAPVDPSDFPLGAAAGFGSAPPHGLGNGSFDSDLELNWEVDGEHPSAVAGHPHADNGVNIHGDVLTGEVVPSSASEGQGIKKEGQSNSSSESVSQVYRFEDSIEIDSNEAELVPQDKANDSASKAATSGDSAPVSTSEILPAALSAPDDAAHAPLGLADYFVAPEEDVHPLQGGTAERTEHPNANLDDSVQFNASLVAAMVDVARAPPPRLPKLPALTKKAPISQQSMFADPTLETPRSQINVDQAIKVIKQANTGPELHYVHSHKPEISLLLALREMLTTDPVAARRLVSQAIVAHSQALPTGQFEPPPLPSPRFALADLPPPPPPPPPAAVATSSQEPNRSPPEGALRRKSTAKKANLSPQEEFMAVPEEASRPTSSHKQRKRFSIKPSQLRRQASKLGSFSFGPSTSMSTPSLVPRNKVGPISPTSRSKSEEEEGSKPTDPATTGDDDDDFNLLPPSPQAATAMNLRSNETRPATATSPHGQGQPPRSTGPRSAL
jgi:hypothetical protein